MMDASIASALRVTVPVDRCVLKSRFFLRFHRNSNRHSLPTIRASLIPRDAQPGKKYGSNALPKVKSLIDAAAFGPRGVMLFGFSSQEVDTIRQWLLQVEATLPVLHMHPTPPSSDDVDCVKTLGDALKMIEKDQSNLVTKYHPEGVPPSEKPVVLFSGLVGDEVVGLLELWNEFTGLPQPGAGAAVEVALDRPLSLLIFEILRAQSKGHGDGKQSLFTIMDKSGKAQATSGEELRQTVQQAVAQQQRRQKKETIKDESDIMLDSMRSAGRMDQDGAKKKKKGFS